MRIGSLTIEHALAGIGRVLRRAHRGARFALAFAVHRTDPNAATVHAAALLHEFAELLLWCHAPTLALAIEKIQREDVAVRSSAAQQQVLNIDLATLQEALISAWQLPRLLSETGREAQTNNGGVRTVALSARLARHTANGMGQRCGAGRHHRDRRTAESVGRGDASPRQRH